MEFVPLLAQAKFGQPNANNDAALAAAAGFGIVFMLIYAAVIILTIAGLWKVFTKAGKPGWAAIVPIYNVIVMLEIVGKPIWWIVLFMIPCANLIVAVIVYIELAKKFGKDALYGILMVLFPFVMFPILGFGSAKYIGGGKKRSVEDEDYDDEPRARRRRRQDDDD